MRAAILVSRQHLYPSSHTPWVRGVVDAIKHLRLNGMTLLTTVGMPTWETILTAARDHQVPVEVLVPAASDVDPTAYEADIAREFELPDHAIVRIHIPEGLKNRSERFEHVDREIIRRADVLFPIALRPGGRLHRLVAESDDPSKQICLDYQIAAAMYENPIKHNWQSLSVRHEIIEKYDNHLVHWTRSLSGPWLDERKIDYYRAVLSSEGNPHTALDTLRRIALSRRIHGSTRHMARGVQVVSFSAAPLLSALALMRWRARYREMSFEPYGIAVPVAEIHRFGLSPVRYGVISEVRDAPQNERWLWQSIGTRTDWRSEKEYRCSGDFSWEEQDEKLLTLFVPSRVEADKLAPITPISVEWLFDNQ